MARQILGLQYGDPLQADHRNFNTLDNRRENLRIVSADANRRYQPSRGGTSRYVGVTWDAQRQKWRAQISISGEVLNLGRYESEDEAARARDAYVIENATGHSLNIDRAL